MALEIQRTEPDLIRVFAVNRDTAHQSLVIKTRGKTGAAADLLGHPIAEGGAELFPVADLAGIGLSGYLEQGYAVPTDQLKDARTRLDALDGYVLLLFSAAFDGRAVTLTPGPDLTLIGTFGETQPDMTLQVLESDAALMQNETPAPTAPKPKSKRPSGSLLILGLIVLVGLALYGVLG